MRLLTDALQVWSPGWSCRPRAEGWETQSQRYPGWLSRKFELPRYAGSEPGSLEARMRAILGEREVKVPAVAVDWKRHLGVRVCSTMARISACNAVRRALLRGESSPSCSESAMAASNLATKDWKSSPAALRWCGGDIVRGEVGGRSVPVP